MVTGKTGPSEKEGQAKEKEEEKTIDRTGWSSDLLLSRATFLHMPKPDPTDRRTRIQKLLELAEREKGKPEGDLALVNARKLHEKGERIYPWPINAQASVDGVACVFTGEDWPEESPLPRAHFRRIVRYPQYVLSQTSSSTASTTTTGYW